jgi:hypothetical protein
VASMQQKFDDQVGETLDAIANRLEGNLTGGNGDIEHSFKQLEEAVDSSQAEKPQRFLAGQLQTFVALSRRMESLTATIGKEI